MSSDRRPLQLYIFSHSKFVHYGAISSLLVKTFPLFFSPAHFKLGMEHLNGLCAQV